MICEYDMDGWANVAGGSWPVQADRTTEFACWFFFSWIRWSWSWNTRVRGLVWNLDGLGWDGTGHVRGKAKQ